MEKMTYGDQLKHPQWQRKRLEMLDDAGWECSNCGSGERTLHVHHRQYFKGRMLWEYEDKELSVLCDACHSEQHRALDAIRFLLVVCDPIELLNVMSGYLAIPRPVPFDPHHYAAGCMAHAMARSTKPQQLAAFDAMGGMEDDFYVDTVNMLRDLG